MKFHDVPGSSSLPDALAGCLLGGAIGDAAGAWLEGAPAQTRVAGWTDAPWELTDDTQMTLATCEAWTATPGDPAAVAGALLRWFRARRLSRLGSSTLKALRDLDAGMHWALAGAKGERAAGNGAAMRIAPLAFSVDLKDARGRQLVRDVCRITHHHEEAYAGALAVVVALQAAISNRPPSPAHIASQLPDSVVRDRLWALSALPDVADVAEAARCTGTSGFVADSVPLALFAAGQLPRIGFASVIEAVLKVGGDVDTIASIAGQVAGASLGAAGLPKGLLRRLPEQAEIERIALAFAESLRTPG